MVKLNPWRRLALVLFGAWLSLVVGVAVYELATRQIGYFVDLKLPVGTVVSDHHATLPDGRVIDLPASGGVGAHAPGAVREDREPAVVELRLRTELLAAAVGFPVLLFLALEILVYLVGWVRRGDAR